MNKKYIAAAACGAALAVSGWYLSTHVWAAGHFYPKSAASLDFTAQSLSVEDYEAIRTALPDCDILWLVPFQDTALPPETQTIALTTLSQTDMELLAYFPELRRIDATGCMDTAALLALEDRMPELTVDFQIPVGTTLYDGHSTSICVENPDCNLLAQQLPLFRQLTEVTLSGTLPAPEALESLTGAFPDISFHWQVPLAGTLVSNSATSLNLAEQELDYDALMEALSLLPQLETVDLRDCSLTQAQLMTLTDEFPDIFFLWNLQIGTFTVPTDSVEIDLTNHHLDTPEEIECFLPYLPKAEKIILSFCGLDDETMDALDKRHPDVRFVWSVRIKDRYLRTDITWFYPYKYYKKMVVNNKDIYPLRYCTDLEWIDIGHMFEVSDCEWARYMPNLTWLIIGETAITDLSPLSGCKKLKFLEMFTIDVTDYSPLLGCTGLEYLNLGRTYGDPEPIGQMTWLKYLWWCNAYGRREMIEADRVEPVNKMIASLPNTLIKIEGVRHPTHSGWRSLPGYFEMRDFVDMFYLPAD